MKCVEEQSMPRVSYQGASALLSMTMQQPTVLVISTALSFYFTVPVLDAGVYTRWRPLPSSGGAHWKHRPQE